ncbi:hypothetical protein FQN54_005083 [Arachnomyces sp. PD_36]|nr:hypothetical protein FQN54_005083 [Arachnomyces sp. PD_36]
MCSGLRDSMIFLAIITHYAGHGNLKHQDPFGRGLCRLLYRADRSAETLVPPQRQLSPLGMHAIKLYREACAHFLDLEDGQICESGRNFIKPKSNGSQPFARMSDPLNIRLSSKSPAPATLRK